MIVFESKDGASGYNPIAAAIPIANIVVFALRRVCP